MADYRRYKTETLEKMLAKAWAKYKKEIEKPGEGWGAGMRKSRLCEYKGLDKARDRYDAIRAELRKRGNSHE